MNRRLLVVVLTLLLSPLPGSAWWVKGHAAITEAAVSRLPEELPAFFRAAGKQIGYLSGEPDRWKNRETPFLRTAESPDHYIDLEDYKGQELPPDRYKAAKLILDLGGSPERAGMLPYAIMEHFDRLTIAYYDYRQFLDRSARLKANGRQLTPAEKADLEAEQSALEMKCIVYAGVLAHYAGDAVMPLHTTVDYDGRTAIRDAEGRKLQQGIHAKIDAFPEKNGFTAEEIGREVEPRFLEDVWKHVKAVILESHGHIDRCYALDAAGAFDRPTEESRQFILHHCRRGAQLLADLYVTAWRRSEKLPPSF
ncbi:MAG: hypothetical protein NZM31_05080 [Gemmatales bacterium]|nr:hypothetical protein [Gemmatales bacterium]MDW8386372.1 hypothetical protein [Gemmatales bacterium]